MRSYIPPHTILVPDHAKRVFEGVIFDVYQWEQELFDGTKKTFEMLRRPDTVDILAVVEDKILVCKERQPNTDYFLDVPAGRHDEPSEDELGAAKRELKEETGYTFNNWKLINARQGSKKVEQIIYTFVATDLEEILEQQLDPGEEIEVLKYSFEEFRQMKFDPLARSYPSAVMEQISSLDELLALPSLHQYD